MDEQTPQPAGLANGVSLLIPAYNEAGAISATITQARAMLEQTLLPGTPWEIVVIDDGSADDTAAIARQTGVTVIAHRQNLGYGAALKSGLRRSTHPVIIITDADGTYPISEVPQMLPHLGPTDMVVGSRTGAEVHIPAIRKPAKWVLKMTAQFLAGRAIPDLNSGLRIFYRKDALRFMSLYPSGFSFTTTITLAYLSSDLLIHYHPINYHPRTGKSKIRPIRDTKNLFLTVVRSILFFNPLRVCLPIGSALLILAALIAIFPRDDHGRIYDGTITILVVSALQIIIVGFLADILARLR